MKLTWISLLLACVALLADDPPFACDRSALSAADRKRHFDEVMPALRKRLIQPAVELENGYGLALPADAATLQLTGEWAGREHLCCPFLEITLRIEPGRNGKLWVQLTGPPGVKEFLRSEFGRWFEQAR